MFTTTTFALLVGIAALIYFTVKKYLSRHDEFWIKKGVKSININAAATLYRRITFKVTIIELGQKLYALLGDVKFGGYIEFGNPVLMVKDLDLLKRILVKDFDHFVDRRTFEFNKEDKILARMMTSLTGKEWKDLRSVMSPTFTTGRIRRMFEFFNSCGRDMAKYMKEASKKDEVLDFQDCFARFTMAAVSSIAFGIQTDTFTNDDSQFKKMAKRFQNFTFLKILKFMFFFLFPKLAKLLGSTLTDKTSMDFFRDVIEQQIKERKKSEGNEKRQDFLQMMIEAQAGQLKVDEKELDGYEKDALIEDSGSKKEYAVVLDDVTIIAQSVLFFAAGFDTLESLLTFVAYELALNPDVQERLAQEVTKSMEENQGNLTYDATHQMQYLDMVVSETLRMYPPAFATERKCTQDYRIPDTNVIIPKGTMINIPITGIQHDERHYPEPLKFNPEHFNPENKAKRHPYAFLPFGQGPRNCIAMRFALTEAKAAIAHLVYNFKIEPSEKTRIPIVYSRKTNILKPEDGMWLKFKARETAGFVKL